MVLAVVAVVVVTALGSLRLSMVTTGLVAAGVLAGAVSGFAGRVVAHGFDALM